MANPQDNYPSSEGHEGEEPKQPIKVVKEARDAAQEIIEDYNLDIGFALVITIPPGYDTVRYSTNIGDEGAVSLFRATADRIEQTSDGGNIETP